MEKKHNYSYSLIFFIVFSLTIISLIFCVLAEFKKSKVEDVKLDGRLCEFPESEAFRFGIAALICFSMAHVFGTLIAFMGFRPNSGKIRSCCQAKSKRSTIASILLVISWINFGTWLILVSTATSMNGRQPYGKGWLDGQCYVVKDGVFIGAAILALVSFGCTLASAIITLRKKYPLPTDEKPKRGAFPSGIK